MCSIGMYIKNCVIKYNYIIISVMIIHTLSTLHITQSCGTCVTNAARAAARLSRTISKTDHSILKQLTTLTKYHSNSIIYIHSIYSAVHVSIPETDTT